MIEALKTFVELYGPAWGTALFLITVFVVVLVGRIERKLYLHAQRQNYAFLDKHLLTYDELVKYQLIEDSAPPLMELKL